MRPTKKRLYQNGGPLGPGDDKPVEGVSMLPTAEVAAQFEPRDEDEAKIYANLGVEGVMALRDMKGAVRGGRDQFARDFMVPALEGALAVETGAGALEMGALAAKFGPKVAQGLMQLVKRGVTKGVNKMGNAAFKTGMRAVKEGEAGINRPKVREGIQPMTDIDGVSYNQRGDFTVRGDYYDKPEVQALLQERGAKLDALEKAAGLPSQSLDVPYETRQYMKAFRQYEDQIDEWNKVFEADGDPGDFPLLTDIMERSNSLDIEAFGDPRIDSNARLIEGLSRLMDQGVTPDKLRKAGYDGAARAMESQMREGFIRQGVSGPTPEALEYYGKEFFGQ